MTLKEATLKQPTPQDQPGAQTPTASGLEDHIPGELVGAPVEDIQMLHSGISSLITDEVLRHKIRTLIEEKPTPSKLQRFLTHQLFLTAIGFLLTGVIGGLLTYYYTLKQKDLDYHRAIRQQELASQRGFSDELNKIRIQKIGEVWEQVDKNELLLDNMLEQTNKPFTSNNQKNQNVDAINNLIQEDRTIINKNRFWLGEQNYNRFQDYLDKNVRIALNMLLARPGTDFSDIKEERKHAKQDILQIRESMRSEGPPAK
jgi:hypothetical protein